MAEKLENIVKQLFKYLSRIDKMQRRSGYNEPNIWAQYMSQNMRNETLYLIAIA